MQAALFREAASAARGETSGHEPLLSRTMPVAGCLQPPAKGVRMTPIIERTVQKTNVWLRDAMQELEWISVQRSYLALRAVLHALRDRLMTPEVAQFGAQLPIFIRGIYYEGWNPSKTPVKDRRKESFLLQIVGDFAHTRNRNVDAEHVARAIFRVLQKHVPGNELEQVKNLLPHEIRNLWPAKKVA